MLMGRMPQGEIIELDPAYDPDQSDRASTWEEPFRQCMRRLASGVSVVSCKSRDEIVGLTATSVTSLSMSPPSLITSVRSASATLPMILQSGRFTVHVLAERMERAADAFAGRLGGGPRASLAEIVEEAGMHRLPGAIAMVDCRVAKVLPVFTHTLIVGVVESAQVGPDEQPLLYFGGNYRRLDVISDG